MEEIVVVIKTAFPHIGFNQEYADKSNLEKATNNPKPIGVYDGTLDNVADINRILAMIWSLFKKEKDVPKIAFKNLATTSFNQDFFSKTLKLKLEGVALFLEFCDVNQKSYQKILTP